MTFIKGVEDFRAYQDAYTLALEVRLLTADMPKIEQFGGVADQMRRASAGICANLAEGFGKNQSKLELRRFVRMAMGSAYEMTFWTKFARDCKYLETSKAEDLLTKYDGVSRMLRGFEQSVSDSPTQHATRNTQHAA
ncbi:MAG: four helix bundle protein [Alphaproteobacteria bacterium]|nr:MAG: four helix bundle protein [Alphaproteobacteria bacterium]